MARKIATALFVIAFFLMGLLQLMYSHNGPEALWIPSDFLRSLF